MCAPTAVFVLLNMFIALIMDACESQAGQGGAALLCMCIFSRLTVATWVTVVTRGGFQMRR